MKKFLALVLALVLALSLAACSGGAGYQIGIPADATNGGRALLLLQQEASLNEIVQLVGKDGLAPGDQLTLETAKMIREDFLQQNAFVEVDSFSNYDRQSRLLAMILDYDRLCRGALEKGADPDALFSLPARAAIGRAKSVPEERYIQAYETIARDMAQQIAQLTEKGGADI